ncbi:hypothetical protein [Legionella maioricensis]|uniref:Uncharacterized protein n=1 Tax=Legionella maioricensis TaxID=2896528 RepID=A0A9X2ICE3_9GAMM|nr:hypothetical protein [Legionella maioricensis]MCL9685146.1 hypothetical protein [Legionella maioricensis]MCL9688341.1 hypothetical protein [Legionella maioricensis]
MISNSIDDHLLQAMNVYYVPVAGYAVIDDYKIIDQLRVWRYVNQLFYGNRCPTFSLALLFSIF